MLLPLPLTCSRHCRPPGFLLHSNTTKGNSGVINWEYRTSRGGGPICTCGMRRQPKRGSSEIASCLIYYIENQISPKVDKLVIFSINCAGQTKNMNLVLALLQFIHSGRFTNIQHIYMVPDHSHLPCAQDFGHIDKLM